MPKLNIEEIKAIIPHRYPFLLIDEIQDYEAGEFCGGKEMRYHQRTLFSGTFSFLSGNAGGFDCGSSGPDRSGGSFGSSGK